MVMFSLIKYNPKKITFLALKMYILQRVKLTIKQLPRDGETHH